MSSESINGGQAGNHAPSDESDESDEFDDEMSDDMSDEMSDDMSDDPGIDDSELDEVRDQLLDARQRLADVSADVVITNHVMGLYELAAIHLAADSPNLAEAALAIDAVACLVEGLGDRLGPDAPTMRDALSNIRLAFVQIKNAAG